MLITRNGEPIAVITSVDHEGLEDYLLSSALSEIADFEQADSELIQGATRSLTDVFGDNGEAVER